MDTLKESASDRHVKFPDPKQNFRSSLSAEFGRQKTRLSQSKADSGNEEVILQDIASDTSEAPRLAKAAEVCYLRKEGTTGTDAVTTEDYVKAQKQENFEFEANALSAVESLAPFRLKWVYGRLQNLPVINVTGLYKNHIAYASSNIVIIYDYVGNHQQCLQGHKNTITSLSMDKSRRFFASSDSGYKSLIIIWDILTGKALKFFPDPHSGKGCLNVTFSGVDHILASLGAEEPGKQTICLWDFDPASRNKLPIVVGHLPTNVELLRELSFDENRPEFFVATGDKAVMFCTWVRASLENENEQDSIFCYKPKRRKNFMTKYKQFCKSLWMKGGEWLVTTTMAGFLCVWMPPMVLGLEEIPDPKKNIRELRRYFKLSEDGLTSFTIYDDYVVVGDERGIIRFFDHDLKLLRWTKNFYLSAVHSIHFNLTQDLPSFKKHLREKFDRETRNYLKKDNGSRVRDYSMGGTKDRELSMTTLVRPPMPCTDFVFSVANGDIYYYHFRESKIDLLVHGTAGKFVACDVCPGSNNIVFSTRKGEINVYDFNTHRLLFSDKIFTGSHRVNTMRFHPTGFFICFGLIDGMLCFRRTFSWKTLISPMTLISNPILRIIFSVDGLLLSYFTNNRIVVLLRYLPKAKSWVSLGKCRTHQLDICDVQFLHDPITRKNRMFSLGLDRYLIEYDIENCNPGDPNGLRVLKILRLEETCQPTAMVFCGPPEFGDDCITFSNTLNKLRVFQYNQERVRTTVSGPVFGRDNSINRLIEFPAQMSATRSKKFIIFIRGNKLGIMDSPLDGNPHKYMAVFTHPGAIIDIALTPEREQIFTIGYQDNSALQWEICARSVEATVLMGGSGITPFYHTIRRNWGGACQDIIKDIDLIFFFLNLKRVDTQTDIFNITRTIRISEIPAVCRACGFYPSEYEVGLMIDEARRTKMLDQHYTDDFTTEYSFDDFIKLFANHYYRISESEVEDAFRYLGFEEREDPYICRSDFVYFLTTEGEKLKPYDFPVYFESMYMDQKLTVFSDIQCHIKPPAAASDTQSSHTGQEHGGRRESDGGSSATSSSSSTMTVEVEDDGKEHSKETHEEKDKEEAPQDATADDDDDDDDDGDEEEGDQKPKKKKAAEETKTEDGQGDNDDDDDDDDDDFDDNEPAKKRKSSASTSEKSKKKSRSSKPRSEEQPEEEDDLEDDSEDLMDLPERIDLTFFLNKMLPPDCQQTIHWRNDFQERRSREVNLTPEEKERQVNREYYDTLIRQIIDPNFPIPKKMLNALYAEYYMEHGNFDVPEELQYPGYGPAQDTWYTEEGEEEELTRHDDDEEDEQAIGRDSLQETISEEQLVRRSSVNVGKKAKVKIFTTTEEEDEEDGEDEDGEEEGYEGTEGGTEEETTATLQVPSTEQFEGDESTLAGGIFQSFRSDEYETHGEDEEETQFYETEEGDGTSIFSAPFSTSEHPQSFDDSILGGISGEGKPSGIVPGYNSDNSEYVSDVENVYEEEDVAFIREVNESFRPQQPEAEADEED